MDTSTNIQWYPSHMETNTTEPENSAHASKSLSLGNPAPRGCPPSSSPSLGQPANPTQPKHSHSDGDNHANLRNLDCGSGAAVLSDDQVALGLTAGIEDHSSQPDSPLQSNTHARLWGKIDALCNACSGSMQTYQAPHSYVGLQSDQAGSLQYRNLVPPASSQPSTSIRASQLPQRHPHIPGGVGGRIHLGQPAQPMHELFPDHEEELSHAEAIRFGAWPDSIRKPKPRVNDYFGTEHHALTLAKVHLYAVALVEDPYMTQGLAMLTASVVHEDTWLANLSGVAYSPAMCEQCEIAGFGFIWAADTEEDFLQNEDLFELVKDSFYCISFDPPEGHYKSREIHRAIGAGLFNSPNSVGILYQDYFNPMPLAVVAFVIAVMEFCIEEWSSGFFEHADLDTKNMLEKYRFHLSELEALRDILSDLVTKLQKEWFEYGMKYSCSSRAPCQSNSRQPTHRSEFWSKTPGVPMESSLQAKGKGRVLV
ncbi:hypothetical protein OPQ81_011219 [Rhizoctonia solani]|nr:hypothetical protein OPQ81_011219 [Rhizoctonia solani]